MSLVILRQSGPPGTVPATVWIDDPSKVGGGYYAIRYVSPEEATAAARQESPQSEPPQASDESEWEEAPESPEYGNVPTENDIVVTLQTFQSYIQALESQKGRLLDHFVGKFHDLYARAIAQSIEDVERDPKLKSLLDFRTDTCTPIIEGAVEGKVRLVYPDGSFAIFKPLVGETIDWGNMIPDGTYSSREACTYQIAKILGFSFSVPPTTILPDERGERPLGTVQKWVDGEVGCRSDLEFDTQELFEAAAFDYVIGQIDRHDGNYLLTQRGNTEFGHLSLIDNGGAFPNNEQDCFSALRATARDHYRIAEEEGTPIEIPESIFKRVEDNYHEVIDTVNAYCGGEAARETAKRIRHFLTQRERFFYANPFTR